MPPTAFCPAPHCQRPRPYTVGEDGVRRCGYCRKELGKEEPVEQELVVNAPVEAPSVRSLLGERLVHLEAQVKALEDRVNGLVAVVASFKAAPPGGIPRVAALTPKKKPARKR